MSVRSLERLLLKRLPAFRRRERPAGLVREKNGFIQLISICTKTQGREVIAYGAWYSICCLLVHDYMSVDGGLPFHSGALEADVSVSLADFTGRNDFEPHLYFRDWGGREQVEQQVIETTVSKAVPFLDSLSDPSALLKRWLDNGIRRNAYIELTRGLTLARAVNDRSSFESFLVCVPKYYPQGMTRQKIDRLVAVLSVGW